jgi:hypothetical protein
MKWVEPILAACFVLSLSGCVVHGKQQQKVATVAPPAPAPAVKPQPEPPPEPLSIQQTTAHLPPAQPIPPEALATIQPAPVPAENPSEPRAGRRPVAAGPVRPRPEPAPVTAQQPTPPPVAPEPEPPRPTVQEIIPAGELKRLQDSADARKAEIKKIVDTARARGLNRDQRALVTRIDSFVQLSDEAEKRNDMRQADSLAERAQILSRELQNGRR